MKQLIIFFLLSGFIVNTFAQKDVRLKEKLQMTKPPFTKEMEDKVIETVKPVKEQIEKLFKEDITGTYKAYSDDMMRLKEIKNVDDLKRAVQKIQKKYYPFVKKIWDQAKIDENSYKKKIRDIFPPEIRETINFTEFLNFSTSYQKPVPPPAPPPPPAPVCVDALTAFFTLEAKTLALNANGSITLSNNFGSVGTGAAVAGFTQMEGALLSDVRIPGTFADDGKSLRITKNYMWNAYANAFSVLGCAFATTSTSTSLNGFTAPGDLNVFIRTWAPVTWFSIVDKQEAKTAQTVVNKQFLRNIRTGIEIYADSFAEIAAGGVGSSVYSNVMWSICEQ